MKRVLKWVLIVGGGLVALVILALLLVPQFVDVERYKPVIESKVSEATGRPFRLAGDLDLSLFPWTGFALSDLHLGNPPGFETEDLLYVRSFDVRVKLLPLISRDVQVERFVLEGVQVNLEKAKDGRTNWEGLGGRKEAQPEQKPQTPEKESPTSGLPLEGLAVGDFSVSGALLWIDHAAGTRKEITDLSLILRKVSLDRPIDLDFGAKLDGNPISLQGIVGPLGRDPMKSSIPLDLQLSALEQLQAHIKGSLEDLASARRYDMTLQVDPFSPRTLLDALDQPLPVEPTDPEVLKRASLNLRATGTPEQVSVQEGRLALDDSTLTFSASARAFSRPDVGFDLRLDEIDLDRYLPPPPEGAKKAETEEAASGQPEEPVDYEPLRRLILDGTVRVGTLVAKGIRVQDILLEVRAKDGVLRLDPFEAKVSQGTVRADAQADVRGTSPKSRFSTRLEGIQAGPLVLQLAGKDIIEGSVRGDIEMRTTGDRPDPIKRNLNGKGQLQFQDGAIVGIDLAGMVRNVQSSFGLAEKPSERPKTDFSELSAPFTVENGVVHTSGTELKSPLLRVVTTGSANLVNETLDLRVEPKVVATLKGQGDAQQRKGLKVPVNVTGTFSKPKFRPDLEGMVREGLKGQVPDASQLKQMIPGSDQSGDESSESTEDKVKGLLKGFGIGQ